ncbi:MAG: hypothetical protein UX83_C0002G0110 [Candidatus Wolfebacteria bacterium GW2011_GWE2_47_12]|nr:MAG: hypothetical protein UX83_C0002G0110 [Candidatus Wolfebacteria bacterium GW2011_GWE2_47_12]
MKEKNIFIIILVVALIGIGVVGYRTYVMDTVTEVAQNRDAGVLPPPPAPADTSAPVVVAPSAIITYGDNGFSPKPITVTAGRTCGLLRLPIRRIPIIPSLMLRSR